MGVYVEPTAAVGVAGLNHLRARRQIAAPGSGVVVVLTGSGLKAGSRIAEAIQVFSGG